VEQMHLRPLDILTSASFWTSVAPLHSCLSGFTCYASSWQFQSRLKTTLFRLAYVC